MRALNPPRISLRLPLVGLACGLFLALAACATPDEPRAEAEAQYERCQPGSGLVRTVPNEPPDWMKPPKKGTCLNLTGPRRES